MNRKLFFYVAIAGLLVLMGSGVGATARSWQANTTAQRPAGFSASPLSPVGSGFTYQGRLASSGNPVNGSYDFIFKLYDALTGGQQVGSTITLTNQTVTNGLFTVPLDFGNSAFQGDARWLEIAVRVAGGPTITTLMPRQELTAAPYAIYAGTAGSAHRVSWPDVDLKPTGYNPLRFANTFANIGGGTEQDYDSVTIGADGFGLISHQTGAGNLRATHCDNLECSISTTATLDIGGSDDVGKFNSVALGADGLGLISYYNWTKGDLKVAHCDNLECSHAITTTLDTGGSHRVGYGDSLTIGADGLGLISYMDNTSGQLKVAHCNDPVCSSAITSTIDNPDTYSSVTSVATGADGLGLISYQSHQRLAVAHCDNQECSHAITTTLDSNQLYTIGTHSSITIGRDGLGLISYDRGIADGSGRSELWVAHCDDQACNSASIFMLDAGGPNNDIVGTYSSVAIGTDGLGLISYFDSTNLDLKVAHCIDVQCSEATLLTLDGSDGTYVGHPSSLTIGIDGLPLIAYHNNTVGAVRVAHCGSPFCTPYFHRR